MPRPLGFISGSAWLYVALLLGVFAVAALAGYVYQYEPARDHIVLRVDRAAPATESRLIGGTVVEVADETLVVERDGERLELTIPPGVPTEDLQRAVDGLPPGAVVNVGAEQTDFGLVFTGLVTIEDGRVEVAP